MMITLSQRDNNGQIQVKISMMQLPAVVIPTIGST